MVDLRSPSGGGGAAERQPRPTRRSAASAPGAARAAVAKRPLWLRLAWRETRGNAAFSLTFVLNLALGLMGFVALDAFKTSLSRHLDGRSKIILGADLLVASRRPLEEAEIETVKKLLPPGSELQPDTGFFSMVATEGTAKPQTRLVEVRAIAPGFPYYGELTLGEAGKVGGSTPKALVTESVAWVYPELLLQLGVKHGDSLKIGDASFKIVDTVVQDPSLATAGVAAAPRVFIGQPFVASTGLVQLGSRVTHAQLVKIPGHADTDELATAIEGALKMSDVRVRTHRRATEQLNRLSTQLSDYLGLIAMVALFLTGVGAAFLYRGFLARRTRDIAILLSLGAEARTARLIYATQLVLLGSAATLCVTILARLVLPALPRVMQGLLPEDMVTYLPAETLLLAWLMGTGGSLLACLPLLASLGTIQPSTLFQEAASPKLERSPRQLAWMIPALAVYWLMAVWQSRSILVGSAFVGIFLASGALLLVVGRLMLAALGRLGKARWLPLRLAALNLVRQRAAALSAFLALGLCSLLLNLIPQVRTVLTNEMESPTGGKLPGLFLVDIQDEQVDGIVQALKDFGTELRYLSPMVRARLVAMNGKSVGGESEGDEASRRANRGYNLSYREKLSSSESLVAGEPFKGAYDATSKDLPEISLEVRFADRLGLGLGDRMTFDVQGVEVEGRITSLRRVRWSSFEPNFFVQFQPGVLDAAPKSFVAAIPELAVDEKVDLQGKLVQAFPNVSIIDVAAIVKRVMELVEQISAAVLFMALLTLVAGFAVLFAIARQKAELRQRDTALLKILGLGFGALRQAALAEFTMLGALAAVPGALLGILAAFLLSWILFDGAWHFDPWAPLLVGVGTALFTTAVGLLAAGRALRAKPLSLLDQTRPT